MKKISLVALALVVVPSLANAQKISEEGFYGFAGAGIYQFKGDNKLFNTSTGAQVGSGKFESDANGWELGLGYEYGPRFAVEGALISAMRREDKDTFATTDGNYTNTDESKSTVSGFRATGIVRHRVSEATRVFASAGVMSFRLKTSESYRDNSYSETYSFNKSFTVGTLGIGVDFALDPRTSLRFGVVKTTGFDFSQTRDGYRQTSDLDGTAANLAVVVRF